MSLDNPAVVMQRLAEIENDLAEKQNELENAALAWFIAKRDREEARAKAFIAAEGTVAERQALADLDAIALGRVEEGAYEALKAVCRVLDTRAAIGMSLLRAQSRS